MRDKNYRGELHLDTSIELFTKLETISDIIINNFRSEKKSYPVEDIIKVKGSRKFNELWEYTSNIPDKKNSKNEFKGLYAFAHVEEYQI